MLQSTVKKVEITDIMPFDWTTRQQSIIYTNKCIFHIHLFNHLFFKKVRVENLAHHSKSTEVLYEEI